MNRHAIMLLNHALYKTGRYTQSESLKLAWQIAKNPLRLNVAGVLFQDRQIQLRNLARVPRRCIQITFHREPNNPYDRNAIQILAQAQGQPPVCIGYLPKEWAAVFAPLMNRGIEIPITFESIVGGRQLGNYGARVTVQVA